MGMSFDTATEHLVRAALEAVSYRFYQIARRLAPLLPQDFAAPIDLKWPEYVTTPRGDEWCVPTPAEGLGTGERL